MSMSPAAVATDSNVSLAKPVCTEAVAEIVLEQDAVEKHQQGVHG
jgi:hypothetical protein